MASKQFLACVLTKCFTNVHDHFREAVTQSRAVNLHLCRWIFVKNSDRTWKSVLFCFVFFSPTTRKWKLSVKKKTEIELKYFSMLFFRDMYIASFFFFQSNVDSNPCWSFARKSLNNAEGVGSFSIYAVPDAWIF